MTSPLPIVENIWTVRAPQTFLGLHVGTQMTIVRLTGGGLVLHSPVAITPELKAQIDTLGPVRHVICPAMFHHLHAGSAIAAWPQARLHAPEALQRKRRDLRFDAVFGEKRLVAGCRDDRKAHFNQFAARFDNARLVRLLY